MSHERRTYPGRPNHCPGAIRGKGRVRHDGPVPTADLVQEHQIDGVIQRVVVVGGAGLCSSCSALERLERERRREPEDGPRTRSRDRVA